MELRTCSQDCFVSGTPCSVFAVTCAISYCERCFIVSYYQIRHIYPPRFGLDVRYSCRIFHYRSPKNMRCDDNALLLGEIANICIDAGLTRAPAPSVFEEALRIRFGAALEERASIDSCPIYATKAPRLSALWQVVFATKAKLAIVQGWQLKHLMARTVLCLAFVGPTE